MGSSAYDLVNKDYSLRTTNPNVYHWDDFKSELQSSWNYLSSGQLTQDLLDATIPGSGKAYRNFINNLSDQLFSYTNYQDNLAYATGKDPSDLPSLWSESLDSVSNRIYDITDGLIGKPVSPSSSSGPSGSGPSGSGSSGVGSSVQPEYINAALAQHYGMSSATAYQEALSNTSYQRAVADMQRAGLNPAVLFGAGRASSAQGVSYIAKQSGSSGGSSSNDNIVSPGMYNLISLISGLAVSKLTRNPSGFFAGQTAAKSIMNILSGR